MLCELRTVTVMTRQNEDFYYGKNYDSKSSSELPKLLAVSRPPPALRDGRDLTVFRELCSDRNRTRTANYLSKLYNLKIIYHHWREDGETWNTGGG